jgi:hypothetical protein
MTTTRWRATFLREPVGPWRRSRDQMLRDLIGRDLGSYDEWGVFYFDALADFETMYIRDHANAA